tara:strand:+ start:276 stop:1007 length:732 start_codon:yes stop_codon:yes gene_type:complete
VYSRVLRHISASDLRESLTLKFRDKLNTVFWKDNSLRGEVREALMKFGKAFAEYVDLPEAAIKDILMLGGNAGYNYTKHSDIDVHLVVDPKYVPDCDPELIDDYYSDKKMLWLLTHDVKVYGAEVEPYVEQPGKKRRKSQGVYSVLKKKWIQEPKQISEDPDESEIAKKANNYKRKIETLIRGDNASGMKAVLKKLNAIRNESLDKYGEYGFDNMVYKELRNSGHIDKVRKALVELKSKSLSL